MTTAETVRGGLVKSDYHEPITKTEHVGTYRQALDLVVGAAQSHLDDLTSGLDDGTYEEGADEVEPLTAAIATIEATPDEITVLLSGGMLQWAVSSALSPIAGIVVIDEDTDGSDDSELYAGHLVHTENVEVTSLSPELQLSVDRYTNNQPGQSCSKCGEPCGGDDDDTMGDEPLCADCADKEEQA